MQTGVLLPGRPLGAAGARAGRRLMLGTLAALSAGTVVVLAVPSLPLAVHWPAARPSLEAAGLAAAALTSALAYLEFSLTGSRSSLLVSVGFFALAVNQIFFAGMLSTRPGEQPVMLWTVGRLIAGCILLAAASVDGGQEQAPRSRPLVEFLRASAVCLVAMGTLAALVWTQGSRLPALTVGNPATLPSTVGLFGHLTFADLALGGLGSALYLTAAFAHAARGNSAFAWLPAALVVAAFGHFHYMLFPAAYPGVLSFGDALRLAFALILATGLVWDVRLTYQSAFERARRLASDYEVELERVRDAEATERERAVLSRMVTHDMGHAVASLRTYAVALEQRWDELDESTRMEVVSWIQRETGRLRDLVEAAGTAAWLDSGSALATSEELVADLLREAVDTVDDLGGRLHVAVAGGAESRRVRVDRVRILQVFRNLLLNAASYSQPQARVDLVVSVRGSEVMFTIRDSGPGIAGTGRTRQGALPLPLRLIGERVTSSGLGLYICREVLEAHGSELRIDSRPGKGTEVSFSLAQVPERW